MESISGSPLAPKSSILRQSFLILVTVATLLLAACGGGASDSENTGDNIPSSSPVDTTPPSVTITGPTSASSYSTGSATLNLSGAASDNVGVTRVTWVNSRGGSGTATGTTSWSISGIALQGGTNTIAVTARDAAGNNTTDTLVVTYSTGTPGDTTTPTITITSPTSGSSYTTTSATMVLTGSASDNVGVTSVVWSNNRGGSGTASGTTSWTTGNITLQGGSNVITVTALDAGGNVASDTLTVTYNVPDTTAPSISITSPTSGSSHTTTSATLSLGGTASDNVGVTQVTWSNNRGGSGSASGTTSWSVGSISLQGGSNVITVTARDAAGNQNTDTLTVTYDTSSADTTRPSVAITSPTTSSTYTATSATLNLSGTASDNVGVVQVRWSNSLGGSGTASGATSWSVSGASLQSGENVFTITAYDAAGNSGAISLIVYYNVAAGSVYYVATTGNDTTGDGSVNNPWKTIGHGISRMAGGDTLIVKKGVYTTRSDFIAGVPSGTAGRYTVVMAEAPMEVRIKSTVSLDYYESQLDINGSYIKVDGFIFDMSNTYYPDHVGNMSGNYNKLTRCIFKRSGDMSAYGGLLYVGGNNNLVEDVAGTGACRYCFEAGGPDASSKRNIYRRVVGRFDYSSSQQPKATFATYGNNGSATAVSEHYYQNIIAIDGQNPATGGEAKYGAFYHPKSASKIFHYGVIILNEKYSYYGVDCDWGDSGAPSPCGSVTHSVVWNSSGGTADPNFSKTSVTAGSGSISISNLLNNPSGATIMKRFGVSGTLWGEPGYDQLTSENLWPWPYEDKIKAVFAETNNPPGGNSPSTNNTKRGFAADGNGLYGGPITLTSYIWEYLGTPMPSGIYQ